MTMVTHNHKIVNNDMVFLDIPILEFVLCLQQPSAEGFSNIE